jgi:hypothetical protein
MSNLTKFKEKYKHSFQNYNNEFILNNPNIKKSLIKFFSDYNLQFYNLINDKSSIEDILNDYFEFIDLKKTKIESFLNTFEKNEIEMVKDFYIAPNLINFSILGNIENLLLWFKFYKQKNLGNIKNFLTELKEFDDYPSLEEKFYSLEFFSDPSINKSKVVNNTIDYNNLDVIIKDIFYNYFFNSVSVNELKEEEYFNLTFLFNILESKITLINHFNKKNKNSYIPITNTFNSIVNCIKNNT